MQFEKWYPIDLLKPPTHAYDLGMILYTGDGDSVIVGAVVTRDGDPVTLTGTVQGYVILPDGSTPPAFSGTIDGNKVSVTLPETAMVLSGRITLAIRVINGDERTVVLGATAMVRRTSSESAYDPDAVIPTWDQVLVKIAALDDAVEAAQGVVNSSVRYDTAQTLTDAQKTQARSNTGSASAETLGNVMDMEAEVLYSGSPSGTRSVSTTLALPAGTYTVSVDNVTSSDTDASTCLFLFMAGSTEIASSQRSFQRGQAQSFTFTTGIDATRFICFASDTYAHGAGDTVTFSGLTITQAYPLLGAVADLTTGLAGVSTEVDSVKDNVTNIAETLYHGTVSGTRSVSVTKDFPAGDYIVQVDEITSSDTDDAFSTVLFSTANNVEITWVNLFRGKPQTALLHLPRDAAKVHFYAGDQYVKSAGDTFAYDNARIVKVNRALLDDRVIPTPAGFGWTNHPLVGHLFRTESGVETDLDVADYKPTGKTYWVSPAGSDSNTGADATHPLQSIRTAMSKADARVVVLMDGFYPASLAPGHIDGLSHNIAVVADTNAHPVISSNSGAHTWTQTDGQTAVYETLADSNAVWDITNGIPYMWLNSVAEVASTASSWYTDGTKTYVHTNDGNAPTAYIRCCTAQENFRVTTSGAVTVYIEGLSIVGGTSGAFRVACDGTNRPKVYGKDCLFVGATTWGACYLEGVESVMQDCEACYSKADGFGIHRNNETVTVSPLTVEINCHGHHNGIAGNTTSNGSTVHAGGKVIRVNGNYHHNVGPNVADVHNNTDSWNLCCHAWKTALTGERGASQSDFIISDGTAEMWLDNCSGYGSRYALSVESPATAYVRGGIYPTMNITGHVESY